MTTQALLRCELPGLTHFSSGKVREIFDLGEHLLFVASDRISAFDVIMAQGIPDKGKILTQISMFWLNQLGVPHHVVTADLDAMPAEVAPHKAALKDRALLVKKLRIFPVECIVRGYLAGSGLKSYRKAGHICGIQLPEGLKEADKLPEPIFTPTTKAESGHDEDMGFDDMVNLIGRDRANELKEKSIEVYMKANAYAAQRGVILCDTKFEWGMADESEPAILADEVLTPDSSRFWPGDDYEPGRPQSSFDKQYLRDWLEDQDWGKTPPPPDLPKEIVEGTRSRYFEIYERLTGQPYQV